MSLESETAGLRDQIEQTLSSIARTEDEPASSARATELARLTRVLGRLMMALQEKEAAYRARSGQS